MSQCAHCKSDAENTYRFAVVEYRATSESKNYVVAKKTTTTVYEKFLGVERIGICNGCIKKERNMFALKGIGATLFCVLCLMLVSRSFTPGSIIAYSVITLGVGAVVFAYSRMRKDSFYASDIRHKMSGNRFRYAPVEASLYCSKSQTTPQIKTFKEKTNLRTEVADRVFEKFVLPGNGDSLIDSIIDSDGRQ